MINTLVIGEGDARLGERGWSCARPVLLRNALKGLHASKERVVVATYSPLVVDAVTRLWAEADLEDWLGRIVLRSSTGELVDRFSRDWLAHFSIADLLTRGEFDHLL